MNPVTLAVTSCNRHELLRRTLESFCQFNSYAIAATVVVEDSDLGPPAWFWELKGLGEPKWIANGARKGQMYTCDRAMAEVRTPYVFWCEDDWEFSRGGFMESSLAILEKEAHVWTVSLRGDKCNGHPLHNDPEFSRPVHVPYWREGWGGMHFNPGLRRLCDWQKIGSYGRHAGYDPRGNLESELRLSKLHLDQGFRIAALPECVTHIGHNKSRAAEKLCSPPKVLIAIPACHSYEYGEYKDKRIGHVDQTTYEKVRGVRETWAKYLPAFHSYVDLKFFFGKPRDGREAFSDEIFLDVPDDYTSLPHKVKAIFQWAWARGYDYIFKCDDDTFIYLDRLMASGFEGHDQLGYCYPSHGNYVSGGCGYWLSRKAMQVILSADVEGWAEDKWVGLTLAEKGIKATRDARYLPGFAKHYVELEKVPHDHSYITFHACTPQMMKQLYAANPTPTFHAVYTPLNEGYEEKGRNCPFNIQHKESVFQAPPRPPEPVIDPRRDNRHILVPSHL